MTDKQTAVMMRLIQDRIYRVRDAIGHYRQRNPEATADDVATHAAGLVNECGSDLNNFMETLETNY